MTVDVAQFRADYSEFSDTGRFPDSLIQYHLDFAYSMLNAARWGKQLDIAAELYAAHWVTLERRAIDESGYGAAPGMSTGPVSSKGGDKVSVSFDTSTASEKNGGNWNLTIYGARLYRLIRLFGMGPMTIGVGCAPPFQVGAWSGPPLWPGYYGNT